MEGFACWDEKICAAVKLAYQTGNPIKIGMREYASMKDFMNGDFIKHRIYTVQEANKAAGKKNSVMIRYK